VTFGIPELTLPARKMTGVSSNRAKRSPIMSDAVDKNGRQRNEDSVFLCLQQLKRGDADAARRLWELYYHRLIGLARKKLRGSPRRAMDEDDVVQSAFKSFCRRAQEGRFPNLQDRDSLWTLLALITARKAVKQRLHECRAKRGGGREAMDKAAIDCVVNRELANVMAGEPSVVDAVLFVSELQRFMTSLDEPTHRLILLWKLEERTNVEIARHLDCSLSAVERHLCVIRKRLRREAVDE
jgi:RNA polymerase sigma factor (sigma-70 family)